jgi:hypothetical protein
LTTSRGLTSTEAIVPAPAAARTLSCKYSSLSKAAALVPMLHECQRRYVSEQLTIQFSIFCMALEPDILALD